MHLEGLHHDSPQKIREAASQFESLLIGQVLKSTHEDGEGGWLGTGEDQTASSAMSLADEYLAQAISQHGGLGLAEMIARRLDPANNSSRVIPTESEFEGKQSRDL